MKSRTPWVVGGAIVLLAGGGVALRSRHAKDGAKPGTEAAQAADSDDDSTAAGSSPLARGDRRGAGATAGGTGSVQGAANNGSGAAAVNSPDEIAAAVRSASNAPGINGMPKDPSGLPPLVPKIVLSAQRPASDHGGDDSSSTVENIIAVTKPDPSQESQIRDLWRLHEDGRRQLLANAPPSPAPPEVSMQTQFGALDGQFEMTLVSKVLHQDQADRLVNALHPVRPGNGAN